MARRSFTVQARVDPTSLALLANEVAKQQTPTIGAIIHYAVETAAQLRIRKGEIRPDVATALEMLDNHRVSLRQLGYDPRARRALSIDMANPTGDETEEQATQQPATPKELSSADILAVMERAVKKEGS